MILANIFVVKDIDVYMIMTKHAFFIYISYKSNLVFLELSPPEKKLGKKKSEHLMVKWRFLGLREKKQGERQFLRHANKSTSSAKAVNVSKGLK